MDLLRSSVVVLFALLKQAARAQRAILILKTGEEIADNSLAGFVLTGIMIGGSRGGRNATLLR